MLEINYRLIIHVLIFNILLMLVVTSAHAQDLQITYSGEFHTKHWDYEVLVETDGTGHVLDRLVLRKYGETESFDEVFLYIEDDGSFRKTSFRGRFTVSGNYIDGVVYQGEFEFHFGDDKDVKTGFIASKI